jgi:hypothetical protein
MIDALIGGRIYGKPAARIAANGNRFATAKLRVPIRDGDVLFLNVIAFDEIAVTALLWPSRKATARRYPVS